MRFAGTNMASYLDDKRPNFGQMAMDSAGFDSAIRNAGTAAMGEVGATGIGAQAAVEAAELVGAAQASAANAQAQGSMFGALGQIAGAGIGAIGTGGFGGGGSYSAGDANVMGRSMSEANHIGSGGFTETVIDGGVIGPTTFGRWK